MHNIYVYMYIYIYICIYIIHTAHRNYIKLRMFFFEGNCQFYKTIDV